MKEIEMLENNQANINNNTVLTKISRLKIELENQKSKA